MDKCSIGASHEIIYAEAIVGLLLKSIDPLYKWLSENLMAHVLTFGKEFGAVIVFISVFCISLNHCVLCYETGKKVTQALRPLKRLI